MEHNSPEHEGFMSEDEIDKIFLNTQTPWFKKAKSEDDRHKITNWFKKENDHPKTLPHHYKIGGKFDCDLVVDEWMKWALTLPSKVNPIAITGKSYAGTNDPENLFLFRSGQTSVYFVATSPYRTDTVRVVIAEQHPLLIPIYFVETSKQENPSLDTPERTFDFMKQDLGGIKEIDANIDDEQIYGCCVFRKRPLSIPNVPRENLFGIPGQRLFDNDYKIEIYHAGLWLLLKPEVLTPGDHLVKFKASAINYEIEGRIQISALV